MYRACIKCTLIGMVLGIAGAAGPLYAARKIPSPVMDLPKPIDPAHKNYLNFLKDFEKRFCTKDVRNTFDQLMKRAQAVNSYVPEDFDGNIDVATVKDGLAELDKKWSWLVQKRDELKNIESWPDRKKIFSPLEDRIDVLLKLKERHFLKGEDTRALKKESKDKRKELQVEFEKIISTLSFLTSYAYPADHLQMRKDYDANKIRENKKQTSRANRLMFSRKLQEDGTFDDDHDNADIYLRTTLNTLSLALKDDDTWLEEDIRHDLEWAIREMRKQLAWGRQRQLQRMQNWINRTAALRTFYRKLLNDKEGQTERAQFVDSREASRKLKKFVYAKNAEVYKALLQESELTQALYVFDQILLHEVGNATPANYRDRIDVAQVVVNSRYHPDLSELDDDETMFEYLEAQGVDEETLESPSWLNVMFKELRFSFTLYYIPAVRHVFCPDQFRTAKITREKNLHLITDVLQNPRLDFRAVRYYSRWSMVGRMDMSKVWRGFKMIPERVGARYKDDSGLKRAIANGKYRYLYSFTELHGGRYHAIEVGPKIYALKGTLQKPEFYAHRDPHKFRFFEEK